MISIGVFPSYRIRYKIMDQIVNKNSKDSKSEELNDDNTTKLTDDETSSDDEKYEDVEELKENSGSKQKKENEEKPIDTPPKNSVVIQKKSEHNTNKDQDLTDEEKKMLENFVVKNLDTNEVTTLLDVVKTVKNPIYTQLIGKVKDYEIVENYIDQPSPLEKDKDEKKEDKDEKKELKKNVWESMGSIFKRKGSEIKNEQKKQPLKYKVNNKTIKQFEGLKVAQKLTAHAGNF